MFRFAAEPFFFERAKHANARQTYAFVMKHFIIAMLIVFPGINLYISGFQYIIGPLFRDAIIVVPIISMGYLLYGIYVNHSIWYKLNDLTRFGIYITLAGAIITVVINVVLIPVYGYMASAWAHVASYGSMIILSFIFAARHYRIQYRMSRLIPYFIIAIGMVICAGMINYGNIAIELIVNTVMIVLFVIYAEYQDKFLSVFFRRNGNGNQYR
jgi:O-antigen/teichoic acid export membrane protein